MKFANGEPDEVLKVYLDDVVQRGKETRLQLLSTSICS